jgi:hypothetical protein
MFDVLWLPNPNSLVFRVSAIAMNNLNQALGRASSALVEFRVSLQRSGLSNAQAQVEMDDFMAYHRTTPNSLEQDWHEWSAWRRAREQAARPQAMSPADEHRFMLQVAEAFDIRPRYIGYATCSCHPGPHPAARDYRRRTKHRNRRRHR